MNPKIRRGIQFFVRFLKDERGGEVLEYAIVAGLVAIAAISMISAVGGKVLARWASINSKM
jgi:Flp pilus assembly pilin Flp